MSYFTYAIYYIPCFLGMIWGDSKALCKIISLSLWLLYAFNFYNGDYDAYEAYYNTRVLSDWGIEIGFGFLMYTSKALGLTYSMFQVIIATISVFLIYRFSMKISKKPALLLSLYALTYFPLDYVLMRNFLAFAIFLNFFLPRLMDLSESNNVLIPMKILICTLFHQTSVFFIIFVLANKRKFLRFVDFIIAFIVLIFLYIVFRYVVISFGFFSDRLHLYDGNTNMFLVTILAYVINFSVVYFFCYIYRGGEDNRVVNFLVNINILLFFMLIPSFDLPILNRIGKYASFINVALMLNIYARGLRLRWFGLAIIFTYCLLVYFVFIFPVNEYTVSPMLNFNYLNNY
ncbi:EpsG family protein [Aeromonas sp.]|uniref:EpsG family protein n=1 Tax=Aeromonas sp. TaxID=647 RepID=UPI00258D12F0|nr:EpsG family protein [Aeromonas sp.]MCX7127044.1 EpsG family protein [Aeromonas sp.]